ncbi:hypothetical protein RP20_CCG019411 [Aedes albopictus]|nr:hypothetical protein RP20_CCG019411 [Aedes albopictus]
MSTISATIQQEQQLELLRAQLVEHQRRKLQQLRQRGAGGNYQKLRKLCRDKTAVAATTTAKTAATKENFLLHKFLFGLEAVAENGGSVKGDGTGANGDCDKMDYFSDKDLKFLRMSEYPNRQQQQGKFVLSQQNQSLLNHRNHSHHNHPQQQQQPAGRPLLSKQNSPIRRPLTCNANFWPNGNNNNCNSNNNVHTTTPTGAYGCFGAPGSGGGINGGTSTGSPPGRDSLLNDENLKSNVQIVLDNISRNYHALREQILSNSIQNNINNNNCIDSKGCTVNPHLVLLQRLQSVSQQLKRTAGVGQQQHQQGVVGCGKMAATSPDSDTNCNPYMPPLSCSIASSQDFSHDYSDYQWFMDYGSYRDGITHQSILSALSASYNGIGELSYYEDLAKNIDANLAEVDMESFRAEDIHSLLTTLPTLCSESAELRRNRNNNRGDLILDTWADATDGHHGGGVGGMAGITTVADLENSICKSKLLFSPVKESHISVDSLDMDGYPDEDDIILTCQANKNNYTIAFEQSALYSDESFYDGPENYAKYKHFNVISNLDHIIRRKAQETAMSVSEVGYTTWSKLRKNGPGQRLPMAVTNPLINHISRHAPTCFVRKSLSMPDLKGKCDGTETDHHSDEVDHCAETTATERLHKEQHSRHQLNVSQAANSGTTSGELFGKQMRTLLPMYPVPSDSGSESSVPLKDTNLDNNDEQTQHQPSFNLVKLFIKQKSSSTDTCMDVSSGCWPSDSTNSASGGENNNNSNTNLAVASSKDRCRKKSMNDSGKCSNLGRHDEEEFQFDSLDAQINNNNNNDGTATADGDERQERTRLNDFNSPVHKRNYKAYNLNIANKNLPAVNPVVYNLMNNNNSGNSAGSNASSGSNQSSNSINNNNNNNNSFKDTNSDASRTSENLTQIFNNNSGNNNSSCNEAASGGAKTKVPIEMITKSMQTSFIGAKDKVRVVPPSFLEHLNKLGDKQKAPVFVVYPNYVLPDLGFLKSQNDVVISPLSFKENFASRSHLRKSRPVSMNDIENLKAKEYKHVLDWKSLITLLPQEYRKLLRNVPEANACSVAEENAPQKPLFCMTPPLRRGRGVTCDCVNILNTQTYNSSSSGGSSSQPPSSGYRGSSTMLTDSEMDLLGPSGSGNNLYVYQYDSPAEVSSAERPPSGRVAPKGILRKTSVQRSSAKAKRNSMFEADHKSGQSLEKRRSLQEPCYNFSEENLILEDSIIELPDSGTRKVNNSPNMSQHQARLPNTPKLPSADDYHRLNKLNEMNDLELNKAVSSKLNRAQQQQSLEDDLEARMRAEHFLSNVPKSELKHYAELAHFLEATTGESTTVAQSEEVYDRQRLRHEVSRALAQRKNVSFNQPPAPGPVNTTPVRQQAQLLRPTEIKFTTPPNSPNMSVTMAQKPPAKPTPSAVQSPSGLATEREKQDKIQSNRFKRLQIQWELLSKEGQQLKQELQQPRSGGNTPTGCAMKSRIPRPVSYPTTRANSDPMVSKTLRSPSRIVPPKRYNAGSLGTVAAIGQHVTSPPTPAPRTPNKPLHTTPKKAATIGTPRIPVGSGQTQGKPRPSSNAAVAAATVAAGPSKVTPKKPSGHMATVANSSPKATIRKPVSGNSNSGGAAAVAVTGKPNKGVVKV